jgi:hypothetical protein
MVSMLLAGLDYAHAYTNSLGWSDSDPTFTHQIYTFDTDDTSSNANAGYINPNGTPTLDIDGALATWAASGAGYGFVNGSGTPYTGIWSANGPQSEALIATMTIPVVATPAAQVLATTVLQTEDTQFASHLVPYIHVNGKDYWADIADVSFTPINPSFGVYGVSMLFDKDILKDPITSPIELKLLSNMPGGQYVRFDRFDIDTIGVPEPGVIAMAITAALTLIGWARLRRRS